MSSNLGLSRATKIVATLGPASSSAEQIRALVEAGVDVFRLNFSHGSAEEHRARAASVRQAAADCGRDIAILADLQGPKIRVSKFKNGKELLQSGQAFRLLVNCPEGDATQVGLDYPELVNDVKTGDTLLLNDGLISMRVESVSSNAIDCIVIEGGVLSDRKGINRQGGGLSAPALTDKDRSDMQVAAAIEADYLAVSFPKSAADMQEAQRLLDALGSKAQTIAKIERVEAIENLEEIIQASKGLMVARGDLAVEVGDAAHRLVGDDPFFSLQDRAEEDEDRTEYGRGPELDHP